MTPCGILFGTLCFLSFLHSGQSGSIHRGTSLPFVIGHRGLLSKYPENTMISFIAALQVGADGIEGDLHKTIDDEIVMIHDDTLNRTTNCTGYVHSYTYAELQSCNANYASKFGNQYGFVPIPRFEEVIALISQPQYNAFLVMDLKEQLILGSLITPIINKYNAQSRVIASCWTWNQIADAQANLTYSSRQYLTSSVPDMTLNPQLWGNYMNAGVRGFSIFYTNITASFVSMAHSRLLSVVAWTVNDIESSLSLTTMGVDGIITDVADVLVQLFDPLQSTVDELIVTDGQNSGNTGLVDTPSPSSTTVGFLTGISGLIVGAVSVFVYTKRLFSLSSLRSYYKKGMTTNPSNSNDYSLVSSNA